MTVIAAGFDSGQLPYKKVEVRREPRIGRRRPVTVELPSSGRGANGAGWPAAPGSANGSSANREPVKVDDELDVPDFLRG